ncbi:MAG: iron-containing alcohol dehydrogenase, partial [Trichococcus flocculiformis]
MATFYVPAINLIGKGCIKELGSNVKELGYKKALFVTDNFLAKSEMIDVVLAELDNA